MTMRVFLIFFLRILYVPFALSQSDPVPSHICIFIGQSQQSITGFKFSINDYPKFCGATIYYAYFLDSDITPMEPENIKAIKSLVAANKIVYILVGFGKEADHWGDIFDPKDQATYDKIMCPLMQTITELGISGIIFVISDIYSGIVTNYANKINKFVTKEKAESSKLKFGLYVDARTSYMNITNNSLFDFTLTNSVLDMYIVDMFNSESICNEDMLNNGGNSIIESSDPNILSLNKLVDAVSKSTMDKGKIIAKMKIPIYMPIKFVSYNKYCQNTNPDDICNSCADNTTTLYNEGMHLKKSFYGVASSWLDYDDYDNTCGCQKFVATKTLFDGFDGAPLTPCAKIDKR